MKYKIKTLLTNGYSIETVAEEMTEEQINKFKQHLQQMMQDGIAWWTCKESTGEIHTIQGKFVMDIILVPVTEEQWR
jgi:hypothetical protein